MQVTNLKSFTERSRGKMNPGFVLRFPGWGFDDLLCQVTALIGCVRLQEVPRVDGCLIFMSIYLSVLDSGELDLGEELPDAADGPLLQGHHPAVGNRPIEAQAFDAQRPGTTFVSPMCGARRHADVERVLLLLQYSSWGIKRNSRRFYSDVIKTRGKTRQVEGFQDGLF